MQRPAQQNNFDFLRLFAAMLVFTAHGLGFNQESSYVCGTAYMDCGQLGVAIFFIISGYLVTRSLVTSTRVSDYLLKRILRIYPAFAVSLLFCGFAIGYMFNADNYHAYVTSKEFLLYLTNLKLIKPFMDKVVPGVFPLNPEQGLNNVYWSLAYEAMCYLLIIPLFFIKNFRFRITLITLTSIVLILFHYGIISERLAASEPYTMTNTILLTNSWLDGILMLFVLFLGGSLMSLLWNKPTLSYLKICLILGFGMVVSGWEKDGIFYGNLLFYICLSVVVVQFGLHSLPVVKHSARFGDFTYGIYIYAWPMQQLVTAFNGGEPMNIFLHMFLSLALTLFFAICSWHYIEKPFLKLKPKGAPPT